MRSMNKLGTWLSLAFTLTACSGSVVVDGPGNGVGGQSGSGSFGESCDNPPNPATLSFCGGSAAVGSGAGPIECASAYCDNAGNTYEADCTGTGCKCTRNGELKCTCSSDNGSDICGSGQTHCCPWDSFND